MAIPDHSHNIRGRVLQVSSTRNPPDSAQPKRVHKLPGVETICRNDLRGKAARPHLLGVMDCPVGITTPAVVGNESVSIDLSSPTGGLSSGPQTRDADESRSSRWEGGGRQERQRSRDDRAIGGGAAARHRVLRPRSSWALPKKVVLGRTCAGYLAQRVDRILSSH